MNNRASLFRLQHVDLADIVKTENTSRWLWMSFAFDVAELWTLATYEFFPSLRVFLNLRECNFQMVAVPYFCSCVLD